jgi:anti-sigma B factor antagonist
MAFDPGAFSISVDNQGARAVVEPRGELDLATAPELEAVLGERLDAGQEVVVDLRRLGFMDSTGLRVILAAHKRVGGAPRFCIVRPPDGGTVARVLTIAGVLDQLAVVDEP